MTAIRGYKEQYYDLLKEVEEYCQRTGTKPCSVFFKLKLDYPLYASGKREYMLSSTKEKIRQFMRDNPNGIKIKKNDVRPPRTIRIEAAQFKALVNPYLEKIGVLKAQLGRAVGMHSLSFYLSEYAVTVPKDAYESMKQFIADNPNGITNVKRRKWTAKEINDAYKAAGCIYG